MLQKLLDIVFYIMDGKRWLNGLEIILTIISITARPIAHRFSTKIAAQCLFEKIWKLQKFPPELGSMKLSWLIPKINLTGLMTSHIKFLFDINL
jgi:hypothetical protein